jgi:hypothetical protein
MARRGNADRIFLVDRPSYHIALGNPPDNESLIAYGFDLDDSVEHVVRVIQEYQQEINHHLDPLGFNGYTTIAIDILRRGLAIEEELLRNKRAFIAFQVYQHQRAEQRLPRKAVRLIGLYMK